jgi:hypothetical protein
LGEQGRLGERADRELASHGVTPVKK